MTSPSATVLDDALDLRQRGPRSTAGEGGRVAVVVPCYNEDARFDSAAFAKFLEEPGRVELVLVNDGSADRTLEILRELESRFPDRVSVIDQNPNQGKAEAVRVGVQYSIAGGARYVGYLDADLATPLDALSEFVRVLDTHPQIDVVLGARVALLGRAIERKASRHYLGRVFATAASAVLSLPVYDTQCGAKLMRASEDIAAVFSRPFGSRWIFDVEMLARYLVGGGAAEGIYELPLARWKDVGDSKVKPRDFVRAVGEMAEIYRNYFAGPKRRRLMALASAGSLRYASAGAVGTTAHYAVLASLVELANAPAPGAAMAGSVAGALVNYILNYHFTFASRAAHTRAALRFGFVALLCAVLNGTGVWLLTGAANMNYLLAQAASTVMVLGFGYQLNRTWTFGKRRPHPAVPAAETSSVTVLTPAATPLATAALVSGLDARTTDAVG